jgi:hypothetical protein
VHRSQYEGNFVNGFREGFGKYTTKGGDVYIGEYEGGELRSKTKVDKASLLTGTDEWGKRIKFHTASLTGDQALESVRHCGTCGLSPTDDH